MNRKNDEQHSKNEHEPANVVVEVGKTSEKTDEDSDKGHGYSFSVPNNVHPAKFYGM